MSRRPFPGPEISDGIGYGALFLKNFGVHHLRKGLFAQNTLPFPDAYAKKAGRKQLQSPRDIPLGEIAMQKSAKGFFHDLMLFFLPHPALSFPITSG